MSSQTVRRLPFVACTLTLGLLLAGAARADDPIADAAARREIADQKVEKQVKHDIEEVASLFGKDSPESAAEVLKKVRETVTDNADLSAERRQQLLALIDGQIKSYSQRANTSRPPTNAQRIAEEAARIREADRTKPDPNSPGGIAGKIIGDRNKQVADARDLRDRQAIASTKVVNDVVKSLVPAVDDVEFPKDWLERTKKRSEVKLTDKEVKLLKALNTPIKDVNFEKMKLNDVLEYLKDKTGVSLDIGKPIMDEVGITYETTVTANLGTVTLRTVLKKVLGDLNLTYIIKDGNVQITTPEKAKQTYSVRAYYVGDLAPIGGIGLGPIVQRLQMAQTITLLMNTIVQMVEPDSWQVINKDAGGTIAFDPLTMSIIVKQTAEMHLMLGVSMRR